MTASRSATLTALDHIADALSDADHDATVKTEDTGGGIVAVRYDRWGDERPAVLTACDEHGPCWLLGIYPTLAAWLSGEGAQYATFEHIENAPAADVARAVIETMGRRDRERAALDGEERATFAALTVAAFADRVAAELQKRAADHVRTYGALLANEREVALRHLSRAGAYQRAASIVRDMATEPDPGDRPEPPAADMARTAEAREDRAAFRDPAPTERTTPLDAAAPEDDCGPFPPLTCGAVSLYDHLRAHVGHAVACASRMVDGHGCTCGELLHDTASHYATPATPEPAADPLGALIAAARIARERLAAKYERYTADWSGEDAAALNGLDRALAPYEGV